MTRSLRHASRSRSAIFAPLGDFSRATRVEQRLADAIRSGLLAEGERLPSEQELAAMLGVATVTAREALVALRAQGLVTTVRGRGGGSFVAAFEDGVALDDRLARMSRVEVRDRGTVYRVVLAGCAELAAEYADAEDAELLRDLLVPLSETDVGVWRHAGSELYLSVAALTQSARMTREVVRHEADFGVLLRLPLESSSFRTATRTHHEALVEAIGRGDSDAARRAMHDQVDDALGELLELREEVRA